MPSQYFPKSHKTSSSSHSNLDGGVYRCFIKSFPDSRNKIDDHLHTNRQTVLSAGETNEVVICGVRRMSLTMVRLMEGASADSSTLSDPIANAP